MENQVTINTAELKSDIINNFIDYWSNDDEERRVMKECANQYVDDDWVDEIGGSMNVRNNEDKSTHSIIILKVVSHKPV